MNHVLTGMDTQWKHVSLPLLAVRGILASRQEAGNYHQTILSTDNDPNTNPRYSCLIANYTNTTPELKPRDSKDVRDHMASG